MKTKQVYIAPAVTTIRIMTDENNLAQLPISSHPIGEDDGLSKDGFFDDEEEEEEDETQPWNAHSPFQ